MVTSKQEVAPEVKVQEQTPSAEPKELSPLPGPVTYDLTLNRQIEVGGHQLEEGDVVGQLVCDKGLEALWLKDAIGRIVRTVKKG